MSKISMIILALTSVFIVRQVSEYILALRETQGADENE